MARNSKCLPPKPEERKYLYESDTVNIQEKEEMLNTFKMEHKAAQDATGVRTAPALRRQCYLSDAEIADAAAGAVLPPSEGLQLR
ncbi:hypothetical protein PRNP1_009554 [Phytophthora ramorum]